ncbi:MAG TPA: Hpt domain-containing protein, partial [Methylophilaceae bacterium]|nr:Hpt domain-containing protein [Methylophilaceae bacterium]
MADSLIDQFVAESHECLAEANDALLALEKDKNSSAALDRLFRTLHTLKGNAALFDFQPIVRVAHVAEDILDTLRKGEEKMSSALADEIFLVIDQIAAWVSALEKDAQLPQSASSTAEDLLQRLQPFSGKAEQAETNREVDFSWVNTLPDHAWLVPEAKTSDSLMALRYTPDEGCFFSGDDPLLIIRELPGICALHVEFGDSPDFAEFEIFNCQATFFALSTAPAKEVTTYCHPLQEQAVFKEISLFDGNTNHHPDQKLFEEVVKSQLRILELPDLFGVNKTRLDASLHTVSNILQYMKLGDNLHQFTDISRQALRSKNLQGVKDFLHGLLEAPVKEIPVTEEHKQPADASTRKFVQIEQAKIDQFLNLIGEMRTATSSLQYLIHQAEKVSHGLATALKDRHAVIDHLAYDMQQIAVSFRMTPMATVFKRYPRMVRDLGKELNRKVKLVIEGNETEADKNIIELLSEPLLHMLRNSLVHGIEAPEERLAAGKHATAVIHLNAFHRDNQLVIEVSDDGRGIDEKRLKEKAISSQLITQDEADRLGSGEALQLIFASGLSLAENITDIAGRGVGMDVVKNSVESVGGTVSVQSEAGRG